MRVFPLAQLFAVPLQSAIRAQALASQETLRLLNQFGLEDGKTRTFRMRADRVVEKTVLNEETGEFETKLVNEPFEIVVPLLALVTPPTSQLQDMSVELAVDVVEPRPEAMSGQPRASTLADQSLAGSRARFTALEGDPNTTMRVSMKLAQAVPEGLARVDDVLTDLLSARPTAELGDDNPLHIERLRGMDPEIAARLRERGITTVLDLTRAAGTAAAVRELADELGISREQIRAWVAEAKRLEEEHRTSSPEGGLDG
jgi:Protein of unknown function (DUF2589)/Domain of unknown function (DUF4332)